MQKNCAHSKRLKDWVSVCRENGPSRLKGLEAFREAMWKRTGLVPRFVVQQRLDSFYPRLDVYESNREYYVTAELPGVGRQDIELLVSSSNLTLRGDRRQAVPEEGHRLFREQSCQVLLVIQSPKPPLVLGRMKTKPCKTGIPKGKAGSPELRLG